MNVSLKTAKAAYWLAWLIGTALIALHELGILPEGYIPRTPGNLYALQMTSVCLTLLCTYGALRLFALGSVKRRLGEKPESLPAWSILRTVILASAIYINIVVYYGLGSGMSTLFCLLITAAGFVFCYPAETGQN